MLKLTVSGPVRQVSNLQHDTLMPGMEAVAILAMKAPTDEKRSRLSTRLSRESEFAEWRLGPCGSPRETTAGVRTGRNHRLHTMLLTDTAPIAIATRFSSQCQTLGHGTAQSPGVTVGWTASYHQPGERYMDGMRQQGTAGWWWWEGWRAKRCWLDGGQD